MRASLERPEVAGLLQAALDQSDEAALLLGARGEILWASRALTVLLGRARGDTKGTRFAELLLPCPGAGTQEEFKQALRAEKRFEGRLLLAREPGANDQDCRSSCWSSAILTPLAEAAPARFLLLLADVTNEVARESLETGRRQFFEIQARLVHILEQPVTLVERLDDVLRFVSSLAEVTGGLRKGIFFTRVAGAATLQATVSVGLSPIQVDKLVHFADLDAPLSRRRPEPRQVQTLFDVAALAEPLGTLSRDPIVHGLTIVPCFSGEELMGVLYLLTTPVLAPELHVQEMLWSIGESCGLAIAKNLVREEWQQAHKASSDSERLKSQFLANITHELRTPLNGILGISSLLEQTALDEDQAELVQTIDRSGRALLRIVEQILDFSQLESAGLSLERRPFDLAGVVHEAVAVLAPQAKAKQLALDWEVPSDLAGARIVGDSGRLQQVLVNLIANAVKFTDEGHIHVGVRGRVALSRDRVDLEFCVEDSGIGIPEDRQEAIFDSFVQLDGSSTRRAGGTGLGLAISRELVQRMGGEIWVESKLGAGSRFLFAIQADLAE